MNSTLFFNNFTCIDHAIINNSGWIVGGSYHPIVELTGKVTQDESVVVDFSAGKKQLKELIDAKDALGFDHKLIVVENYSDATVNHLQGNIINITTPMLNITLPASDVRFVHNKDNLTATKAIEAEMQAYLTEKLDNKFDVKVKLTHEAFVVTNNSIFFRYVHGLKDSTSYGCKNIAHGHLSFFEITEFGPEYSEDCEDCQLGMRNIVAYFTELMERDSVMFINSANITYRDENQIIFGYKTPRGVMQMTVYTDARNKIVVLDTETTVEYLAEYLKCELATYLALAKVKQFRISEGLQKGAVINL